MFEEQGRPVDLSNTWSDLSFTLAAQGDRQGAIDSLTYARSIAEEAWLPWDEERHKELINEFEGGGSGEHEHPDKVSA